MQRGPEAGADRKRIAGIARQRQLTHVHALALLRRCAAFAAAAQQSSGTTAMIRCTAPDRWAIAFPLAFLAPHKRVALAPALARVALAPPIPSLELSLTCFWGPLLLSALLWSARPCGCLLSHALSHAQIYIVSSLLPLLVLFAAAANHTCMTCVFNFYFLSQLDEERACGDVLVQVHSMRAFVSAQKQCSLHKVAQATMPCNLARFQA